MTPADLLSLAQQRQALRLRLLAQRRRIADLLAPAAGPAGSYPRSLTMQLVVDRPALVNWLVALMAGARFAGAVPAIRGLFDLLRAVAIDVRTTPPAAQHEFEITPATASEPELRSAPGLSLNPNS